MADPAGDLIFMPNFILFSKSYNFFCFKKIAIEKSNSYNFQSNSYRKDFNWLHFDDDPKAQGTQVKEQHAKIGTISSFLMK